MPHRLCDRTSPSISFISSLAIEGQLPLSNTCFRHQPRYPEPHRRNLTSGDLTRLRPLSLSNPFFLFPLPHIAPSISSLDL